VSASWCGLTNTVPREILTHQIDLFGALQAIITKGLLAAPNGGDARRDQVKGRSLVGSLDRPRLECQVMNAVIRIETSSPGNSTPSLAT
jgi:hypothetical protein